MLFELCPEPIYFGVRIGFLTVPYRPCPLPRIVLILMADAFSAEHNSCSQVAWSGCTTPPLHNSRRSPEQVLFVPIRH